MWLVRYTEEKSGCVQQSNCPKWKYEQRKCTFMFMVDGILFAIIHYPLLKGWHTIDDMWLAIPPTEGVFPHLIDIGSGHLPCFDLWTVSTQNVWHFWAEALWSIRSFFQGSCHKNRHVVYRYLSFNWSPRMRRHLEQSHRWPQATCHTNEK